MPSNTNTKTRVQILENYLTWDGRKYLSRYTGPIFAFVANIHESLIDDRIVDRVVVNTVKDTGHYIMLDQCDELQQYLTNIINS